MMGDKNMESNKKILEALKMQPLSEEEKASRHILGRLWGPIATTKEKTRNGRGYNMELWRKALADEIFCEKVANKSLFLELGHPVDREETDMQLVCACIPELPKIVDGDLYAYVDILDTKNGRLLKTLCDYGFVPGISSRGSGDIMANDDVDPETFFLETWDIVQLPAVKKARLSVCESLSTSKRLSKALCEAFASEDSESKKEIEETLRGLGYDEIELAPEEANMEVLTFADFDESLEIKEATEEVTPELEADDLADEKSNEEDDDDKKAMDEETDTAEAEDTAEDEDEDEPEEEEAIEDGELTVDALIKHLDDFDKDLTIEFGTIKVNDTELNLTEFIMDDTVEDDKLIINFNYDLVNPDDDIEDEEDSEEKADKVENAEDASDDSDEAEEDAEANSEEAIDDGDDEVVESIKTLVRQKEALEEKVLTLKSHKTVSDAKILALTEERDKYKTGFMRTSELASKATKLQKEVTTLNEQLSSKETTLLKLKAKLNTQTVLNESIDNSKRHVEELTERLTRVQADAEATENELTQQLTESRQKLKERTAIAKAYKEKYTRVVEHYIASKANMLGVSTRDISSKLQENYTIEDIDKICDSLLESGRPSFGFGIGAQGNSRVSMKESTVTQARNPEYGYEIDDDLLKLAGLIN